MHFLNYKRLVSVASVVLHHLLLALIALVEAGRYHCPTETPRPRFCWSLRALLVCRFTALLALTPTYTLRFVNIIEYVVTPVQRVLGPVLLGQVDVVKLRALNVATSLGLDVIVGSHVL